MPATLEREASPSDLIDVEVSDYLGQETVNLGPMESSTPVGDVLGISKTRLQGLPSVEYMLRDTASSRLLRTDQPVGDVAEEGRASLRLQPDARLG